MTREGVADVAVQMRSPDVRLANEALRCVPYLEHLAQVSGGDRARAAAAVAQAAVDLVGADAAFVLGPGERPGVVEAVASAAQGKSPVLPGETWQLGIAAARLFAHPWQVGAGKRESWEALRGAIGESGLRSWASTPVRDAAGGQGAALVVAGRHNERAGRRLDLLPPLAASAAVALEGCTVGERAAADELEADERRHALSNLAFGLSHSLGNIFGAILGNLQMLQSEVSDPRVAELVRRIDESSEAGLDLMRALRDYALLPGTRGMTAVDLNALTRSAVELTRSLCAPWQALAAVSLEVDLDAVCPAWGDAAQLRQALLSVIFNAVEAVAGDGHVQISTGAEGNRSLVAVHDDGIGMDADAARRASEPFFTTRPAPHRGLGLTLARGIAVAHRGGLKISRPREGGTIVAMAIAQEPPPAPDAWPCGEAR